jgi:hypothetical protein
MGVIGSLAAVEAAPRKSYPQSVGVAPNGTNGALVPVGTDGKRRSEAESGHRCVLCVD